MAKITTIDQARTAGAYDAQNGQGAYTNAFNPAQLLKNSDAQNQLLADGNPEAFNNAADAAGFSKIPTQAIGATAKPITIPVNVMEGQVSPYALQSARVPVAQTGLSGFLDALGQERSAQIDQLANPQDISEQRRGVNELTSIIYNDMLGAHGKTSLENEYYKEEVNPSKKALTEINTELTNKTVAYKRQIEQIRENKSGMFGGAVEAEVGRIERQANQDLANISLRQMAAQGRWADAKEVADRAVSAAVEEQGQKIEARKFAHNSLKDDLTKAEERRFQLITQEMERQYNQQKEDVKTIKDMSIEASQNGAPDSVMKAILDTTSSSDAMRLAAPYIGKLEREQQAFNQGIQRSQLAISQGNLDLARQKYNDDKNANTAGDPKVVQQVQSAGKQLDNSIDAISKVISKVEKNQGFKAAVGTGFRKFLGGIPGVPNNIFTTGTKKADFETEIERLKGALTLPALESMRGLGAMSEVEFNTVRSSISSLNTNMTEVAFKEELGRINTSLNMSKARNAAQVATYNGTPSVPVMTADGKAGVIPVNQIDEALAEGYIIIE